MKKPGRSSRTESREPRLARGETPPSGFDFSRHMRRLCVDMARRLPELQHIQMPKVAVAVAQTRHPVAHGLYASLTPLRFEDGRREGQVNGKPYGVERVLDARGEELLYILTFYLPRFMEVDLGEKLITIVHELWHVSPHFDGDIRRFSGRCYAHSSSQKDYDAEMQVMAKRWLALDPPEHLYAFLRLNFAQLQSTFGRVTGTMIRRPRLIPLGKTG